MRVARLFFLGEAHAVMDTRCMYDVEVEVVGQHVRVKDCLLPAQLVAMVGVTDDRATDGGRDGSAVETPRSRAGRKNRQGVVRGTARSGGESPGRSEKNGGTVPAASRQELRDRDDPGGDLSP